MDILIGGSIGVLGAICASFVCVIAERAYTGQSWKRGRSRCNSCRQTLQTRDLIPVLSWARYGGKCRMCRARVPVMYAAVELGVGILFYFAYVKLGLSVALLLFLIALLLILFVVLYDLRHTLVPLAAAGWLIVVAGAFQIMTAPSLAELGWNVAVALGIALFFYLLYALSRGRAMGLGDTPIAFALSLLVGSQAIAGFLFSFWIGGLIGIGILVIRQGGPRMGIEVPFVPFLAAGYLLAFYTQWNPLPYPLL